MKKLLAVLILLLTLPTQKISSMKRSNSTEDLKNLDKLINPYYQKVRSTLVKINPQAMILAKDPELLCLNVALELNEALLHHKRFDNPDLAFFFAVTELKIPRDDLKLLLSSCRLDPMNTLKTFQVCSKYIEKTSS